MAEQPLGNPAGAVDRIVIRVQTVGAAHLPDMLSGKSLAELARINTAMASLALRIMEGSASDAERACYAQRLIAAGERLRRRANGTSGVVIEGEVLADT